MIAVIDPELQPLICNVWFHPLVFRSSPNIRKPSQNDYFSLFSNKQKWGCLQVYKEPGLPLLVFDDIFQPLSLKHPYSHLKSNSVDGLC